MKKKIVTEISHNALCKVIPFYYSGGLEFCRNHTQVHISTEKEDTERSSKLRNLKSGLRTALFNYAALKSLYCAEMPVLPRANIGINQCSPTSF